MNLKTGENVNQLNKLKTERNYTYEDELICSKECLPNYEEKVENIYNIME